MVPLLFPQSVHHLTSASFSLLLGVSEAAHKLEQPLTSPPSHCLGLHPITQRVYTQIEMMWPPQAKIYPSDDKAVRAVIVNKDE